MEKMEIGIDAICYPMPCSLIGANVEGKANFLTVAWFSMVNLKPPYLMIALGKAHYSNPGIAENGTFSVNIPVASMVEATDYCGLVSGKKFEKEKLFEVFYGKLKTAPMIRECAYNLECRLVKTVELEGDELFIGEVVAAFCDPQYLTNGVPDLGKMNTFVLSMPERKYIALGRELALAWEIGKKLIRKDE
ncbi:MAG: Flavoredoxin [Syntrophorhabdaceae bacterium PtaU1.Bin034]|nr:MAG: Flavoredoxin [Syntrophorhabdaceae bacterium PtaU1.Bin034]